LNFSRSVNIRYPSAPSYPCRAQREPIDGSDHVILRHVENDLTGHKVLSIAIRHNGDDQVALDALYLAGKHRADADDLDEFSRASLAIIAATSGNASAIRNAASACSVSVVIFYLS
jgi:hypothetical protein